MKVYEFHFDVLVSPIGVGSPVLCSLYVPAATVDEAIVVIESMCINNVVSGYFLVNPD